MLFVEKYLYIYILYIHYSICSVYGRERDLAKAISIRKPSPCLEATDLKSKQHVTAAVLELLKFRRTWEAWVFPPFSQHTVLAVCCLLRCIMQRLASCRAFHSGVFSWSSTPATSVMHMLLWLFCVERFYSMWFLKEKSDHYRKQSFLWVFLALVCFEFPFLCSSFRQLLFTRSHLVNVRFIYFSNCLFFLNFKRLTLKKGVKVKSSQERLTVLSQPVEFIWFPLSVSVCPSCLFLPSFSPPFSLPPLTQIDLMCLAWV